MVGSSPHYGFTTITTTCERNVIERKTKQFFSGFAIAFHHNDIGWIKNS